VWILNRHISPIDAVKTGQDAVVCFDCKHRGEFSKRTCYVNLRTPQAIWRAYQRGRYAYLPMDQYAAAFSDKTIRYGAYGEPVLIPLAKMQLLSSVSRGWTGYTHQWRRSEFEPYRAYVMASCDSPQDAIDAVSSGWRYFRVRTAGESLLAGEISCPASDESGHKTQCARCRLCNGAKPADGRKSIGIIVHGVGKKNFVSVNAIAAAAAVGVSA
jgi:hypothetical protein